MTNFTNMSDVGLIAYCGTVPSTQDLAREILQAPPVQIRAVVAEHQTAGRGRRGNRWHDTPGDSLLMTVLLPLNPTEVAQATQLAFVMALAVGDALKLQTELEPSFKWSNDLLVRGRKIAGILIETATDALGNHWALVGVGVNLLQREFPRELSAKATSVWLETGRVVSVEPLAQEILRLAGEWMQRWQQAGFQSVLAEWRKRDITSGYRYRLPSGNVVLARGVSDRGELIVELQGEPQYITSAEPAFGVYAGEDSE